MGAHSGYSVHRGPKPKPLVGARPYVFQPKRYGGHLTWVSWRQIFLPWLLECILVESEEPPQGSMEALDNTLSVVVTWFCDAPLNVVLLEERRDFLVEKL